MQKRYTTWNEYLRTNFGEKIFKVPIDAGFDCLIGMVRLLMVDVLFVQYLVQGT